MLQAEANSPARELRPGQRIDRYELLRPIGRGGMGSVWAARHGARGAETIVAIKTVLPDLASDARVRAMFLEEARLASAISHPNVAHIIELLECEGALYLVIEWVDGAPLNLIADALAAREQRIPPGILLRILADVCAGLHAAHELRDPSGVPCDLVHRDVSPHNVLVGVDGVAKLIDFGVAKARHRAASETTFGVLKGKLHFMAPEQALGDTVDRRADVWSVGAMTYYMLAGHGPFDCGARMDTLRLLVGGAPRLPLPPDVHPAIERIVSGCLARRPQDRFATAEQLASAIEAAIEEMGVTASSKDVGSLVEECTGLDMSGERPVAGQEIGDVPAAPLSWTESTGQVYRRSLRRRSLTWVALAGFCLLPAIPLAIAHASRSESAPMPATLAVAAPAEPSAVVPPVSAATPIVSVAPSFLAGARVSVVHPRPKVAPALPPRPVQKARPPAPPPPATPPKRSDDFGSAVDTRK
jgi:serine/threonine protein kinase